MKNKKYHSFLHRTAATVFAIVTFVHALRLAYSVPITIAGTVMPLWISWLGVFLAGVLAVTLWQTAKN